MNRFFGSVLFALTLISSTTWAGTFSYDSTGITKKGGKTFIVHVVDEGETLFSLSRRYSVSVDDLYIENPEAKGGLYIGQTLLIPLIETSKAPANAKVHVVKPSETLYSIARMYDVTPGEIKRWNNLHDNTIGVGDKLFIKKDKSVPSTTSEPVAVHVTPSDSGKKTHTVQPSETLYSISRQYNVNITDLKNWNHLAGNEISIGQVLIVSNETSGATNEVEKHSSMLPGKEEKSQQQPEVAVNVSSESQNPVNTTVATGESASSDDGSSDTDSDIKTTYENKKVVENGFAEVIEGSTDTKKYLALHRTAPIGTIMQVRNEMNNQTVFVRVVGNIPDTGNNKNVLIKISKKAFDRLGSVDPKFPVEVSYIP